MLMKKMLYTILESWDNNSEAWDNGWEEVNMVMLMVPKQVPASIACLQYIYFNLLYPVLS